MIAAYPNAKVILNTRDVDAWYTSVLATFGVVHAGWVRRFRSWFGPELFWRIRVVDRLFYRYFFDDFRATGKWVYVQHGAMVRGLVETDRLLEWSVTDGWSPLCKFLNKEVPLEEFPSGNAPQAFMKTSARVGASRLRVADRNMAAFFSILCVMIGALYAWYISRMERF